MIMIIRMILIITISIQIIVLLSNILTIIIRTTSATPRIPGGGQSPGGWGAGKDCYCI